jgi:hypothetical protein
MACIMASVDRHLPVLWQNIAAALIDASVNPKCLTG